MCPAHANVTSVDVLHRSSKQQYTRGARWRQAGRSKGVSCQDACSNMDMLRGIGNMTTTKARGLLIPWPQPVSAGNNAPQTRRRIKDVKSNLPPDSKGGSCELYGTPVAPARPCTQKQQTPKHPDHEIYQYQSIYAHGIVYVTVGSHPAHTVCTLLLHWSLAR